MSVLALYTSSFPYGEAESFLETEISILSLHFEKVYIVPFRGEGEIRDVPGNVEVLSPVQNKKWPSLKIYMAGFLSCYFIFKIPELKKELKRTSILKAIKYLGYTILTKNRLKGIIPSEISVHYSYWLNFNAFALALLKLEGRIKTVISRAHGYDLYEERGEKSLTFIKAATLRYSDKLFLISEHGLNYILKIIPQFSQKYTLSRLGTSEPEFVNPSTDNSCLTLVSCSSITKNKRLNLIIDSLALFKTKFPTVNVSWHHLGGGSEMSKYVDLVKKTLKDSKVQCFIPGQMTHPEILNFYRTVPVDLFVNVSEYEGIPVSIMEAQSFGIPVIATAVGGTPEIVNNKNGYLLPADPTPDEITEAISDAVINKENWEVKRVLSRKNWEEKFDALKNYTAFTEELLTLG
jgi:glycosyltransferase involved in cell wall biosynthesis